MSLYDYERARELVRSDVPFYALIMAATMMWADTCNAALLRSAFPGVWHEVQARYDAPGGCLEGD